MRVLLLSFSFLFVLSLNIQLVQGQDLQLDSTLLTASDVATGLQVPWEVLWGEDDHLWVTERRGRVLRINPENGNTVTILNHESAVAHDGGEYGMLGMALHPDFTNTAEVFIAYTYFSGFNIEERLVKFRWNGAGLTDETILLDEIPGGSIHDGSRLLMTPDNKILMTTGDRGNSDLSQNMNSLNGKILRINLDGSIPDDNPIAGSYIYSYGHRNPQGLAYGPNGQLYSSEHGAQQSDEFNIIEANRNYGWPNVQGACNTGSEIAFCNANNVREPLDEYSPCVAVNGIEFYDHPAIPEWEGKMLMAVLGGFVQAPRLSVLTFDEEGTQVTQEDQYLDDLGRLRDVAINPHTGAVYVATNGTFYPGNGPNRIIEYRNLAYTPNNVGEAVPTDQFVRIFPNPVEETLTLEVSPSFLGSAYEIISFSGQTIETGVIREVNGQIAVADWPAGMYFVRAVNERGMITRTFAKQ